MFFDKSIFNAGEVNYLTIKENDSYHIFYNADVIRQLTQNTNVENSKARHSGQTSDQKVVFKWQEKTLGEIEMRSDSKVHYREVKFWLDKIRTINLLKENIKDIKQLRDRLLVYGKAINKFKKY